MTGPGEVLVSLCWRSCAGPDVSMRPGLRAGHRVKKWNPGPSVPDLLGSSR